MELMQLLSNLEPHKIYGLMGNIDINTNNKNYAIINPYQFSGPVKEYLNHPKSVEALKISTLDETYLEKTIEDLSFSEIKKVNLASSLLSNKEYLIFNYFEKDLTSKEKEDFKRLFKRLSSHKTIVIFTNDLTFLWEIIDTIIYVLDNDIKYFSKKDYTILNYISKPNIIKFIELVRKKGLNIENYKSTSDLLKAIYRLKEN